MSRFFPSFPWSAFFLFCWSAFLSVLFDKVEAADAAPASAGLTKTTITSQYVADLLVSDRVDEVAQGRELAARFRGDLMAEIIRLLAAPEGSLRANAAVDLGIIISPWCQGIEARYWHERYGIFIAPRRPVSRSSGVPEQAALRAALKTAFHEIFTDEGQVYTSASKGVRSGYSYRGPDGIMEDILLGLGEFADDPQADLDWALAELDQVPLYNRKSHMLLRLIATHLGIPAPGFFPFSCGTLSEAEKRQIFRKDQARQNFERQKARSLVMRWKSQIPEERVRQAIEVWHDLQAQPAQSPGFSGLSFDAANWLWEDLTPLIRLGEPAILPIREQQRKEVTLMTKAFWECAIAAITGVEDKELVRLLLRGTEEKKLRALEIILAAGSTQWTSELNALQQSQGAVAERASQLLASILKAESLPLLNEALRLNPANRQAKDAIEELTARQADPDHPHLRWPHRW